MYRINSMKAVFMFVLFSCVWNNYGMSLHGIFDKEREKEFLKKLARKAVKAMCAKPICENLDVCIKNGLDVESCNKHGVRLLTLAVIHGYADACELLIAHGADAIKADKNGETSLTLAAEDGKKNIVRVLLTTIPPKVRESIRQCMFGLTWVGRVTSELNPIIRKLVAQKLIDLLVADQIPRIENMITFKEKSTQMTAGELALEKSKHSWLSIHERKALKEVARMLDLSDPESCTMLLKQLEANIKRILFGEPATIVIRRQNQWYHSNK